MSTFFQWRGVNLFCGDDAEGKWLTIEEVSLPELDEATDTYVPGGGHVEVEFATHLEKLEAGFNLKGEDRSIYSHFGLGAREPRKYTILGEIVNKRNGALVEGRAVIEARLGKIAPGTIKQGDLRGYEYGLTEILHYEVYEAGEELFFWDFWTNQVRSGGNDRGSATNSILQIG